MKRIHISLITTVIILLCACQHEITKEVELLTQRTDSLLELYPDSALRILQGFCLKPETPPAASARYALSLACATDKSELSLTPCDSLLKLALNYYRNTEYRRSVALLYQGRLEAEKGEKEEAIRHLQEAWSILEEYPKMIEAKKLVLGSLGNLFYTSNLYKEAIKVYKELYKYCSTNKDKAIALNCIGNYYALHDFKDSAFITQNEALKYALLSRDSSIIADSYLSLSIYYDYFEQTDSALWHAKAAVENMPRKGSRGKYYYNLGIIMQEAEMNPDSAFYYINEGKQDTTFEGRFLATYNLSEIEEKKGNYLTAIRLLKEYIENIDSISVAERSNEIQQLIHKYDVALHVKNEKIKRNELIKLTIFCSIVFCLVLILIYQHYLNKKEKAQLVYQEALRHTKSQLSALQHTIEEHEEMISQLQQKQDNLVQEREYTQGIIQEKEQTIEKLEQEKQSLRSWLFTQSHIYKKIKELSAQETSNKKELQVLTHVEQGKLKKIVFDIFADYKSTLQAQYPQLTEDDILYLCLNEMHFSSKLIARCFGYTDTHPINQRKLRIKERMRSQSGRL